MKKKFFLISSIIIIGVIIPASGFSLTLAEQAKEYREKGYEAQSSGNIEDAISFYQKAAALDPNYATPHNDLGIIYETKLWLDRAEEEYKKALAIDPNYAKAHTNLAFLYERKGEIEKAAFHWMRRYKLGDPEDAWTKEAKQRIEKLGLIEKEVQKIERPSARVARPAEREPPERLKEVQPFQKEIKQKKERIPEVQKEKQAEPPPSKWTRIGAPQEEIPESKIEQPAKPAKLTESAEDVRRKQLEASLKLAEERLREERRKAQTTVDKSANRYYNDAQNFYKNGEYVRALDSLRKAKETSPDDRSIPQLENEIKNKMKEERISDHCAEGMKYFKQKNFTKAKEEFEAILSILPE